MEIRIDRIGQSVKFTPAEVRVIGYLLDGGLTNSQIAERIASASGTPYTDRTVQVHVTNILAKTELANRTALALWAVGQSEFSST